MMFEEKRPTCVTVIGWAWIVIGGLMCVSTVVGGMQYWASRAQWQQFAGLSSFFKVWLVLAAVQAVLGVAGLTAGIHFLRLRPWSRKVLQVLTLILLALVIAVGCFWVLTVFAQIGRGEAVGETLAFVITGVVVVGIYVVPLAIMWRYLKGDRVRAAVAAVAVELGPDKVPDGTEAAGSEARTDSEAAAASAGPKGRLRDEVFQAVFIAAFAVAGAVAGHAVLPAHGLLVGTLLGLIAGLFVSGVWVWFCRLLRD